MNRRTRTIVALGALPLLGLGVAVGVANAQDNSQPMMQEPGGEEMTSHEQAARTLIDTMDMPEQVMSGMEASLAAQMQANPALRDAMPVLEEWMSEYITWDQFDDQFVDIYTDAFTEQELEKLNEFYTTPLGQKTLETMPMLRQRGAQIGMQVAQQNLPELRRMLQESGAMPAAPGGPGGGGN
jgi:hypothetical protein